MLNLTSKIGMIETNNGWEADVTIFLDGEVYKHYVTDEEFSSQREAFDAGLEDFTDFVTYHNK